jgi:cytidylate kinase
MIITISGLAGTGTTSLSRELRDALGYEYIYAGQIFREEAERRKMSIDSFVELLKKHPEIDKSIDLKMVDYAKSHDKIILEGRLTAYMMEKHDIPALKVLLVAPYEVSTQRVANREGISLEEADHLVKKRDKTDHQRYLDFYDIDIHDESVYDYVIDSNTLTIQEEVDMILEILKNM